SPPFEIPHQEKVTDKHSHGNDRDRLQRILLSDLLHLKYRLQYVHVGVFQLRAIKCLVFAKDALLCFGHISTVQGRTVYLVVIPQLLINTSILHKSQYHRTDHAGADHTHTSGDVQGERASFRESFRNDPKHRGPEECFTQPENGSCHQHHNAVRRRQQV